jgi:DNA-binding CsgD family transcriptional regulator
LSEREREIVSLWSEDKTDKDVADQLGLSIETVKSYAKQIRLKLRVHTRAAVCRKLWESEQGNRRDRSG